MKKIILFVLLFFMLLGGLLFYRSNEKKVQTQTKTVLSVANELTKPSIKHVFVIVMENTNWSTIKENRSAPYINSLLKDKHVSYATQYYAFTHPSEPNYIWLEAGDARNLSNGKTFVSLTSDADPTVTNSSSTTEHLTTLLEKNHLSWKAYTEGISGTTCPLTSSEATHFAARHVPMLFFQDVTNDSEKCTSHIRPFSELADDLVHNTVPNYSFIVPNLCNDMHDLFNCETLNRITNGDTWLSSTIPSITSSSVFKDSVIFLTWDEGSGASTRPIGMIVISPFAKGDGYHNMIHYTHSSLLRTVQEIFSLKPLLRDANNASSLYDLFTSY